MTGRRDATGEHPGGLRTDTAGHTAQLGRQPSPTKPKSRKEPATAEYRAVPVELGCKAVRIEEERRVAQVEPEYQASQVEPLACVAYTFDGSTEGMLTAIFQAYERHEDPQDIFREGAMQPQLGQNIIAVETEPELAQRVRAGIQKRGGRYAWELVLHASLADDADAPTTVYRFVRLIMSRSAAANAMLAHELTDPVVGRMIELDRFVRNERHHMLQFLRFEHMAGDVWFARCNPKANVVGLLMDWFAGRFNTQRFIIYDEVHCVAGVFDGENWMLVSTEEITLPQHSAEEATMQAAWKGFYDAVSVPIRYHPELRRQFMPKRFWKNILEVRDELPANTPAAPESALLRTKNLCLQHSDRALLRPQST